VSDSPIEQLLSAIDRLDLDGAMTLAAPDIRALTADGRRAQGADAVRGLIGDLIGSLRSTSHRITTHWQIDDMWIAEVEASYELSDWLQLTALPRAFIVRTGPDGIHELRVYGAHELPLTYHRTGEEGLRVGEHWIPPL
jgi:hypothetical protein